MTYSFCTTTSWAPTFSAMTHVTDSTYNFNYEAAITDKYDFLFKVLLVGDSGVGKTSLLSRFADGVYNPTFIPTIGVDFRVGTITLDDKVVKLQIWDTAGQERFKSIVSNYYRGSQGALIVYDITDYESFVNTQKWLNDIRHFGPTDMKMVLIGQKSDLTKHREVDKCEAEKFADKLDIPFVEVSAKESVNITTLFETIAREVKHGIYDKSLIHSGNNTRSPTLQGSQICRQKSKQTCCSIL